MKRRDLTGLRFGRLLALACEARPDNRGRSTAWWKCSCSCGELTFVVANSLVRGATKSCGCLEDESRHRTKHGGTGTHLYTVWLNMRGRCYKSYLPEFKNYGGRGITVCEAWRTSFEAFRDGVGEPPSAEHSLDRIDNDGNYEPGNVRWATYKEQGRNKRGTIKITLGGETMSLADAAERFGVPYDRAHNRIFELGWTVEEALDFVERRFNGSPVYAPRER